MRWDEASADEVHVGKRGQMFLWRPAPDVFVTRSLGHLQIPDVRFYQTRVDTVTTSGTPVYIFHNLASVTGWDPDVRPQTTEWAARRKGLLCGTHMLVTSSLQAMAVSVAALALGRPIHAYSSLTSFESALARVLHR